MLRERFSGNSDKFIDVITKQYGIIEICVKGARKITSKNLAPAMLFSYSRFCLKKRKNMYYIDSARLLHSFYGVTSDIKAVALASYIAEVLACSAMSVQSDNIMRLVLNTFHFLASGTHDINLLKAVFELRFMSETGFLPNLTACHECAAYETDLMYLVINEGIILCQNCFQTDKNEYCVRMNRAVLHAVRYIMLSDFDKIFSFRLKNQSLSQLCRLSEMYILYQLDRNFKTLDFYKSLERY